MPVPTLADQRIVIIGGSSGIGLAVAEGALAEGARVVIASSKGANVEAGLKQLGGAASGGVIDVREENSVAEFFERQEAFDHLVFTAGEEGPGSAPGPLSQLDIAQAGAGLQVRFWGALRAIKHAQPRLSPTGSVTITDGVLAHLARKGVPLVSAFAGAIEHLARALAVDLAPIRVNTVCPGLVLTKRAAHVPGEMIRKMTEHQPVPRAAEPAEAAQAYLYLMRNGYVTGQVLIVDGGRTLV